MYHAKAEKSGWAFYDSSRVRQDAARLTLIGELRRALDHRELVLHYQPKAILADGEVHAVEALVRWNHPIRGLVAPDDFIPMAQQTGLIKPLTLYVIDEALRQCRAWQDDGLRLAIAVNLSARSLWTPTSRAGRRSCSSAGTSSPRLLEFEITESAMLADPARTKLILEQLSAIGIRLSIDDFGTGYSSLAYLKRLPVSEIKIDRSFVMNMDKDEDDATIVRSTIDLGRNLGLDVVAEGVESEQVWDRLKALGCTAAQGYYLSRPLPEAELPPGSRPTARRRPRRSRSASRNRAVRAATRPEARSRAWGPARMSLSGSSCADLLDAGPLHRHRSSRQARATGATRAVGPQPAAPRSSSARLSASSSEARRTARSSRG